MQTERIMTVEAGETYILTEGDYSSYTVLGVMTALCDFDFNEAFKEAWEKDVRLRKYDTFFDHDIFIKYLVDSGMIEMLTYGEFNFDFIDMPEGKDA